jgi:hypothetical protein
MLEEFTQEDWDTFAGAENFPCEGRPLISHGFPQGHTTVLGKDQVEIISNDLETIYAYDVAFPTQEGARVFYRGLTDRIAITYALERHLKVIGFKNIS